jgi:hypothetical protein
MLPAPFEKGGLTSSYRQFEQERPGLARPAPTLSKPPSLARTHLLQGGIYMRTGSKLILAGLGATLLMAFAVNTASARNFSVSNQTFRGTFNNLEFEGAGVVRDTCRVTIEGSLHTRTIAKVAGSLVGYITRVTIGQCSEPTTVLTATLPWHVSYESFSGRLPDITLLILRATGVSFRVSICLARGDMRFRISRDPVSGHLILLEIPSQNVPIIEGFLCPEEGRFHSIERGQIYQQGSTTRVSLTLI